MDDPIAQILEVTDPHNRNETYILVATSEGEGTLNSFFLIIPSDFSFFLFLKSIFLDVFHNLTWYVSLRNFRQLEKDIFHGLTFFRMVFVC